MFKSLGLLWIAFGTLFTAFNELAAMLLAITRTGRGMADNFEMVQTMENEEERQVIQARIAARKAEELVALQATVPAITTSSKAKS